MFQTYLLRGLFVLGLALSMVMILHPEVRTAIRKSVKPEDRTVLSVALAQLGDGIPYRVVKVRTLEGIQIEVYKSQNETRMNLVDRVDLPQHKDAHFSFSGGSTNLAVDDINGDGRTEVIVPSLDKQLVAHLAIFEFHPETGRLKRLLPDEIKY